MQNESATAPRRDFFPVPAASLADYSHEKNTGAVP